MQATVFQCPLDKKVVIVAKTYLIYLNMKKNPLLFHSKYVETKALEASE